ncbi:CsbD family protein [Streptomyces sp. NBC_00053]|uniref:CsbD family protein n=1 Tax=unclassified Streptomyces TaxID=2593676 RepID=UPI000F5BBE60|nr:MULTISPECIES: CsbD family protein [unclassified Streptomyces]WSG53802.1 CsbD family protein [Streptomyces sp. NBC_01732]WSX04438.1 CsbD family protein [Streptomyces sp. NBC_00987]MCX4393476.1 CsbD family protein [Streptomyces sp. NBC_01767]MCX5105427.1 CsbD family protein [Streptomyces sp. NBC_00439]MCX5163426.1 CsbD family protein [Streptomyces sp. NBC_00305]
MVDEGAKDKIKGKAKEAMGKMTGDRRKEAEGKMDQAKGRAKGAEERAEGMKDSLRRDEH